MPILDANGHALSGSDEESLPNQGKEAREGEEAAKAEKEGGEKMQDARLIPRGTLVYNLTMVVNNLFMMSIQMEQMESMMKQQRAIVDPPPLVEMKAQLVRLQRSRDIIVNNLNDRYASDDERYWASLPDEDKDKAEAEQPPEPEQQAEEG
jgi:hypothetical protein